MTFGSGTFKGEIRVKFKRERAVGVQPYAGSDSILDARRHDLSILVERGVKNVFIFYRNVKILLLKIKSYQSMLRLTYIRIDTNIHHSL